MNICLVDDDPIMRLMLGEILQRIPDSIVHDFSTAEKAWDFLQATQAIDICLFDIQMPGLDGLGLLQRMKENSRLKKIPVVFITLSADRKRVSEAMRLGVKDYILKPFEAQRVLETIEKLTPKHTDNQDDGNLHLESSKAVMERLDVTPPTYKKMVEAFIIEIESALEEMKQWAQEDDVFSILSRIDGLRGSCLTLGAQTLKMAFERLLQNPQNMDFSIIEKALSEIKKTLSERFKTSSLQVEAKIAEEEVTSNFNI